jgi:hypothetical protein
MTPTFVLFEMQGQQVLVAEEAKSRGLRTVTLNHDPLRTSGPFAVREGIIDEHIHVASWSEEDVVRRLVREVERGNDIVGVHASFEPTQRYAIELRDRLGLPHNTVEDAPCPGQGMGTAASSRRGTVPASAHDAGRGPDLGHLAVRRSGRAQAGQWHGQRAVFRRRIPR